MTVITWEDVLEVAMGRQLDPQTLGVLMASGAAAWPAGFYEMTRLAREGSKQTTAVAW